MFAVDPTLMIADPGDGSVPLVTHLYGGEVQSGSDGGPNSWFTATGVVGPAYSTVVPTSPGSAVDYYPNEQLSATLWYHDHAMGITRLNVMSGLAGFYLLKDPLNPLEWKLPAGKYDIPLAIQDRIFNDDGSMVFPSGDPTNPDIHPVWVPEFFGNTIMVNGKVWPNLNVDKGQYRLRLLDGSNARFYNLGFHIGTTDGAVLPFTQIGTDGGFIKSPVALTSLQIAPGERADVLVDFSSLAPGTLIFLTNNAAAPYPDGDPADPLTTGQILRFSVTSKTGKPATNLPSILNPTLVTPLPNPKDNQRLLPMIEVEGAGGPIAMYLNGQSFEGQLTETPRVGSTEDWYFINLTPDTHPMHLHLVQFQIVKRMEFDAEKYLADWTALNGQVPIANDKTPTNLAIDSYLTGQVVYPKPNGLAWKDTVQSPKGWITVVRVRFAPQSAPLTGPKSPTPGKNLYPFDPTTGPGYVWHCHIIDHEDNEMMRPYVVVK